MDVAFSDARFSGMADQRLDRWNGVAKVFRRRAKGMAQAVTGDAGHVRSRHLLKPPGEAGMMLGVRRDGWKDVFGIGLGRGLFQDSDDGRPDRTDALAGLAVTQPYGHANG